MGLSAGALGAGGLVMLAMPGTLIGMFNPDPALLVVGVPLFRTLAFAEPMIAVSLVLTGCLRGAGDAMWPFLVSLLTLLGVQLGLGYLSVVYFAWGLQALWIIVVLAMALRLVLLLARFLAGRWKKIEI